MGLAARCDAATVRDAPRVRPWRALALVALLSAAAAPAGAQEPTGGTSPAPPPAAPAPETSSRERSLAPPPTANLYGKPAPLVKRFACRSSCGAAGSRAPAR